MIRLPVLVAAFIAAIGMTGCGAAGPTSPLVAASTTVRPTLIPMPSSAPAALTSSGGVAVLAQMLTDSGFECVPNRRFTSCQSSSTMVRVAAWKAADGAASEIGATFHPDAAPGEVTDVLSLLDRIAPGTRNVAETYRASAVTEPQYETVGRVNLTLTREAGGVVSVVLRPA